jgi:hypothetical protein
MRREPRPAIALELDMDQAETHEHRPDKKGQQQAKDETMNPYAAAGEHRQVDGRTRTTKATISATAGADWKRSISKW